MATRDSSTPRDTDHTSRRLLARVRFGDSSAVARLVERYLPRLRRWARGKLPRRARGSLDSSDLVQDALLRTLPRVGGLSLPGKRALGAYLYQAVQNRVIDEHRRLGRRGEHEPLRDDMSSEAPSPFEQALTRENTERYRAALAALSPEDRALIVGHVECDYNHAQLGALTSRQPNAARMALQRAIQRLTEHMRDA